MNTYSEYLPEGAEDKIIAALSDAYRDNGGEYFRPEVGNTILSFAIAAWQSSLHNLEKAFPEIDGIQRCVRSGNVFFIEFTKCRLSFFKFQPLDSASSFRLVGTSRNRERIVRGNQQMVLFDMPTKDVIVIHTGTPEDGLLEAHIGAPISANRDMDGWIWRDELYSVPADYTANGSTQVRPFTVIEEPVVEVSPEEDDESIIAFNELTVEEFALEEEVFGDEDSQTEDHGS